MTGGRYLLQPGAAGHCRVEGEMNIKGIHISTVKF